MSSCSFYSSGSKTDGLWSEGCQWNERWSDLTESQKQGLMNDVYTENCNCEVKAYPICASIIGKKSTVLLSFLENL